MFSLARRANEHTPKLYTFDPKGFRRDVVEFHPAYHELMRASIASGLQASSWTTVDARTDGVGFARVDLDAGRRARRRARRGRASSALLHGRAGRERASMPGHYD